MNMNTLGLIGGLTSESTAVYYELLNKEVKARLGAQYSSQLLLWSFNLSAVLPLYLDDKPAYIDAITEAGEMLKSNGVAALMICSNSAHMAAEQLAERTQLPVLHILDALAVALEHKEIKRPLVLGTDFVMEEDFYIPNLCKRVDIDPLIPNADDRKVLNDILFTELISGTINPESRKRYLRVIEKAESEGADGVILGCTEHCLLLNQSHHHLPMLDSTSLHVKAAINFQLS